MSGAGALSDRRLAWRMVTGRRRGSAALWLCLAAAMALPTLLLLVGAMATESGLVQALDRAGGFSVRQDVPDVDAFNALDRQVDSRVTARTGARLVPLGAMAAIGSLRVLTVRTEPAPADLARRTLTAVYVAHLASHVTVVAGELPPDALGGGETAASMSLADADQLGLRLSDRICGDFGSPPGSPPLWCVRIVSLWQPLVTGDPFWAGATPGPTLAVGRSDLFGLARLGAPGQPAATVRYWASAGAVTPDRAAELAGGLGALASDLRAPGRRVDSQLDGTLRAFAGQERLVSAAIQTLAALVAVLGVGAAAVVGGRLLDGQQRELMLLRARGWSRGRVWRMAFRGLRTLALTAAAVAIAACLLVAAALTVGGSGLDALTLRMSDAPAMLVTPAAVGAALIGLLAALAARGVWPDPGPSLQRATGPLPHAGLTAAVLALAGVAALALARFAKAPVPLAAPGLGLLAAAAALRPLVPWVPGRDSVHRALAGFQLRRHPGQYAGAAFVLTLATAVSVFAALGLTGDRLGEVALWLGLAAGLAAGGVGGLLLALAVCGLHFRSAARRRIREYGGLLAHGLAPEQVERSLAGEQLAVAANCLLVGVVVGVALAVAVLPGPPLLGAVTGLGAVVAVALGIALAGAVARRLPSRVELL